MLKWERKLLEKNVFGENYWAQRILPSSGGYLFLTSNEKTDFDGTVCRA